MAAAAIPTAADIDAAIAAATAKPGVSTCCPGEKPDHAGRNDGEGEDSEHGVQAP